MAEAETLEKSADQNPDQTSAVDKGVPPEGVSPPRADRSTGAAKASESDTDGGKPSNVIWPADWRKRVAGEDEKLLKKAERYTDPAAVFKALTEAERRISQGFKPAELTDKSTDEEVKAYREQNGIPESWDKYATDIGNGVVFGDEDKPIIDHFLEHSHKANMPQKYVTAALSWYHDLQQEQQAQVDEADIEHQTNTTVELKETWGGEYRQNLNAIKGVLNSIDTELFDVLFSSRDQNGVLLGSNAQVLKAFAQLVRQANPAAILAPGAVEDSKKSIDQEIADIQKAMAVPSYGRLPQAERDKKFQRLLDLNAAKERIGGSADPRSLDVSA